jgi:hypothetical protein
MPHISPPTRYMSTAPRAPVSSASKPPLPYLGSKKGESNPIEKRGQLKSSLISRLDPLKYEVDALRVLNLMTQRVSNRSHREYKADEHTRGLVRDDNTTV